MAEDLIDRPRPRTRLCPPLPPPAPAPRSDDDDDARATRRTETTPLASGMPPQPRRRAGGRGAVRRAPLRRRNVNARWMHLNAGQIGARSSLQYLWNNHLLMATATTYLATHAIVLRRIINQPAVSQALDPVIYHLIGDVARISQRALTLSATDSWLYDIPLHEYLQAMEFRPRRHLRIGDLQSDNHARKMTGFSVSQLERLYRCFGLRQYVLGNIDRVILVGKGTFRPNGSEHCYRFEPEELFLFTLTKCKTGESNTSLIDNWFGGDYSRWSYGYRWMLKYLDRRYEGILGYAGILRFLPEFPRFRDAIDRYLRKDKVYRDNNGVETIYPGLNGSPFNICGLIDCSIDATRAPFSGPADDCEGAPRRPEYHAAQESIWSGWKKLHGIKVETVFFPNGLTCLFGPVSCRSNDRGTLNLSGLDTFLEMIQAGLPLNLVCWLFGDSAYRGNLRRITSYYRSALGRLTVSELRCNKAFRSMRIPIERNYGQTSCVMRICDTARSYQLGKRSPYALEQLRVGHLLMNCYICLNGDQASSVNTFDCSPPRLEEYLAL